MSNDRVEIEYSEVDKFSDDLVVGDEFRVGGLLCIIAKKTKNSYGQHVLECGIVGATTKKRNKLTLIVPDKTPFTVLEIWKD